MAAPQARIACRDFQSHSSSQYSNRMNLSNDDTPKEKFAAADLTACESHREQSQPPRIHSIKGSH
jgi:hypothetical protein